MIGMWVDISDGNLYRVGRIERIVGDRYVLIRLRKDCCNGPTPTLLYELDLLKTQGENGSFFFDDEADLNAWLKWLCGPTKPSKLKVVSLKPESAEG